MELPLDVELPSVLCDDDVNDVVNEVSIEEKSVKNNSEDINKPTKVVVVTDWLTGAGTIFSPSLVNEVSAEEKNVKDDNNDAESPTKVVVESD